MLEGSIVVAPDFMRGSGERWVGSRVARGEAIVRGSDANHYCEEKMRVVLKQ